MWKYCCGVVLFLVLCSCASVNTGKQVKIEGYPNKPDLVVYEFCDADAYGARLSEDTMKMVRKYFAGSVSLPVDTSKIYVITDFKIKGFQVLEDYATVQVKYTLVAIVENNQLITDIKTIPPNVDFILTRENGLWKISASKIPPCVYKETVLTYIDGLSEKASAEEKVKLQYLGFELKDIN